MKHSVRQQLTKLKDKIVNILLIQVTEFTVSSFALVCSKKRLLVLLEETSFLEIAFLPFCRTCHQLKMNKYY